MARMESITFDNVPSWCTYTPTEIKVHFEFNLNGASGRVKYKCVHCLKEKTDHIGSIRRYVRRGIFTSLCTKCRGDVQRLKPLDRYQITSLPSFMYVWMSDNGKTVKDLEDTLNSGVRCDINYRGELHRAVKYSCFRCSREINAITGRLERQIRLNLHTGLCRYCVSSVKNNVSVDKIDRETNRGYPLVRKSQVPKETHHLFDWSKPVMMHRYVIAVKLGRSLTRDEIVHHIDGDKWNYDVSNLELWNKSHPSGQRIEDKIKWAKQILKLYKDYKLR